MSGPAIERQRDINHAKAQRSWGRLHVSLFFFVVLVVVVAPCNRNGSAESQLVGFCGAGGLVDLNAPPGRDYWPINKLCA